MGHDSGPDSLGDEAAELVVDGAFSYSARRQASEQYTPPSVCLSQDRQKSGDQSISIDIVSVGLGMDASWRGMSRKFEGGRRLS